MHRNIRKMFLLTTLVFLLVGLATISASDVNDNQNPQNFKENTINEVNKELSTNTQNTLPTTKSEINKNQNIKTKQNNEEIATTLVLEFINNPSDEFSTENYKTTHLNEEYTIDITLTADADNTPIPGQIQLYLPEQTEAIDITLNETGHTQKTYTAQYIGEYFIYAEYEGNANYQATASDYIILNTEQYFPTLTINNIENQCYNSTITIEGLLLNDTTPMTNENIIISFNNNQITTTQTDNTGKYSYNFSMENIPIQEFAKISVEYISNSEEYADAYNQIQFSIEKIRNNIQVNPIQNTVVANKVNFTAKVTDENNKNYTGTLKAKIKNKDTQIEVYNNNSISHNNGEYSFIFVPTASGNYELTLQTDESEYYLEQIQKTDFTVDKATPTIYYEDSYESIVQENVSITARVLNEYQQPLENIEVIISTPTEIMGTIFTDNEGFFHFTKYIYQETVEDEYKTIYFDINADDNHYPLHIESQNYVSRRNTKVTLSSDNLVKINGTLHINGQVTDAYNESIKPSGTISLYIEDTLAKDNIAVTNGLYQSSIEIEDKYLGKEQLYLEAFFIPSNPQIYYSDNYAYSTVDLDLLESILTINANDTFVGQSTNITLKLTDENNNNLNKTVSLLITNEDNGNTALNETIHLTNGTVNIIFTPQTQGIYHITAQYDGEENIYKKTIQEEEIIVRKIDTKISLNNTSDVIYVNNTIKITGTLTDTNNNTLPNQNITVIINATTETKEETVQTDMEGKYEYLFKALLPQQYNITAIFEETNKYNGNYTKITINPTKHETIVIIQNIEETKYNSSISIQGQVLDKELNSPANGSVTIFLNDQSIDTLTLQNGAYTLQYQIQTTQSNEIRVLFNENDVYKESEETTEFITKQLETTITINPIATTQINKTLTVTGYVKDENNNNVNGKLEIRINNQLIMDDVNVENGFFTLTYRADTVGINQINLTFKPDESYHKGTISSDTFNVTRANLQLINVEKQSNNKDQSITITGQLVNDNNIPTDNLEVNITINDTSYPITTDDNGIFTLTTDKLRPDEYSIHLTVNQTEYFNKLENNLGSLIIQKLNPIINLNNITNVTYSKDLFITGNLTDEYNRTLTDYDIIITVENIQYSTKTDNHGQYNLTVNNFQAGTNNLNITVPETDYTNNATLNTTFNAKKDTAHIILQPQESIIPGETLIITGTLVNSDNNGISNKTVTITVNEKAYNVTTNSEGRFIKQLPNTLAGNYTINVLFEDSNYEKTNTTTKINVDKVEIQLVVDDIVAYVGENITFRASLTDQYGNPVNGGNIVFKLNGRTLRSDGRFDTDNPSVLKFNVINGVVEYTLTADLYLRHGKNISASYSGSYRYLSAKSNTAQANIKLRYADINVTATPNTVKHHENITFTANLKDVTPNSSNDLLNQNTSVIFKINGVSIKDSQNNVIKTPVINNTAVFNYNISTMAGIDTNANPRDYVVTAVYDNSKYYPVNNKNTTTFNVERSIVNIDINEAKVNNNKLSIKANLTDYLGLNLEGKSKICIKINGVTYKEDSVAKYYTIENGVLDINDINVENIKVKRLEIVTGQRLAYYSARQSTADITYS